jgi:hypothetical protein
VPVLLEHSLSNNLTGSFSIEFTHLRRSEAKAHLVLDYSLDPDPSRPE